MTHRSRQFVTVCIVIVAVTLIFSVSARAQVSGKQYWIQPVLRVRPGAAQPHVSPLAIKPSQSAINVYLPSIIKTPEVSPVQFATSIDDNKQLVNPSLSFERGINTLYMASTIVGGQEYRYSTKLIIDGEAEDRDTDFGISLDNQYILDGFCYVEVPYSCENTDKLRPMPYNTITFQVFLNANLASEGTATIH